MSETITINSEVPFGHTLHTWLYVRNLPLEQLVNHGYVEKSYLAWETVRKQSNPYFETGTGFEGYFVGRCTNPEEALSAIIAINQHILDAIARLYHFEYGFRQHLMRTLTREESDSGAIHIWSEYLGAELGRLRAQILLEPEALEFQRQTYKIISMFPPMKFYENSGEVMQSYAVGSLPTPHLTKLLITPQMLNPNQRDAWLVAENIGVFGHPLVRRLLDYL